MKKLAAIYIRVSTREQAEEGYSLDAQKRILVDYCKAHKYDVYKIYADEGISGKDIKHRPKMRHMIADAKEDKFNVLLIWKLSRLSRSMVDLTNTCKLLDDHNIKLVSYSEGFDSSTPSGRMVRSILGSVAEFDREVIAENVSLGMLERARQGKRMCFNAIVGYDMIPDSFVINKKEAEYVNFLHDEYIKRKSISEVTRLAQEKGYKGKLGGDPKIQSVHLILTRPEYAGYNLHHGVLYKGDYEAIRTPKQFNKVQRIIKRQGILYGRKRIHPLYIVPED